PSAAGRGGPLVTRRGPGEGSIYQRSSDGRWEGALHLGYVNGKRKRAFEIGHSRKEVADKLAVKQQLFRERRPIPDGRARLGPFLLTWLEDVARPRVRATTHESYADIVTL